MTLREAINYLLVDVEIGDFVYQIRERCDFSELSEDQSSWDHPDVIKFQEAVSALEQHKAGIQQGGTGK